MLCTPVTLSNPTRPTTENPEGKTRAVAFGFRLIGVEDVVAEEGGGGFEEPEADAMMRVLGVEEWGVALAWSSRSTRS